MCYFEQGLLTVHMRRWGLLMMPGRKSSQINYIDSQIYPGMKWADMGVCPSKVRGVLSPVGPPRVRLHTVWLDYDEGRDRGRAERGKMCREPYTREPEAGSIML